MYVNAKYKQKAHLLKNFRSEFNYLVEKTISRDKKNHGELLLVFFLSTLIVFVRTENYAET
jgi:hypothetical protein